MFPSSWMLSSLKRLLTPNTAMSKYSSQTKEQLIARIHELERQLPPNQQQQLQQQSQSQSQSQSHRKPQRAFDQSKYATRRIALRFSYLGWDYNGLAIQKDPTPLPTVEGVLIEALHKCRMVPSLNPHDFAFSRCGRTDRGVSALNQVVSLKVRSNLSNEEQMDPENDSREVDYVNILNSLLPEDIKIHSISLRPPAGFDARFSCISRHYRYIFHSNGLDIERIKNAAALYEGEHDFRNFCKLDGSKQISNYKRTIIKSQILHLHNDVYCFDLQGSAFLWHQVRNMVAVLFLVGQGLEEASIVTRLTDVEGEFPTKPLYEMADDLPLVLYDCSFPPMEWIPANSTQKKIKTERVVYSQWIKNTVKTQMSSFMREFFPLTEDVGKVRMNIGDGQGKVVGDYVPLAFRDRMEGFEVVNARYSDKKRQRKI